ncbi:MAG: hydantoinase/oxoprolinase family protein [Polyangiales bacterium]
MLINIDNGGTFTDVCVIDGEKVFRAKTPTTPFDLSECFFEGIRKASVQVFGQEDVEGLLAKTEHIRYSTTQGTNALVERKGPRIGLILESGFDPSSLSPSDGVRDMFSALVGDRIAHLRADAEEPAFETSVVDAVNELTQGGANRLVLSLTSMADEKRAERVIRRRFPEHLLGTVPVLTSTEITGDPDLTRRTWTAMFNAFLHPSIEKFLYHAQHRLQEYKFRSPLLIYRNDGDAGRVAKTTAIKTYSSGPRGGMDGAQALAEHYDFAELLTMDVGGTTTDIGLVTAEGIRQQAQGEVAGAPVALPLCEIAAVGVGGGSIIRAVDGEIQVGPESTGATPGPACFGLGGTEATITDFALLAGIIDPATYFAGTMNLDRSRAESAVRARIAEPLGLDFDAALIAMERAWVGKIATALREFAGSSDKTVLGGFGGAGPLAVCAVAEQAGLDRVIVPRMAAAFCALGIAFSDIGHSYDVHLASGCSAEDLEEALKALKERARRDMFAEGFELADCVSSVWLSLGSNGRQRKVAIDDLSSLGSVLRGTETPVLSLRTHRPLPHASFSGGEESRASKLEISGSREVLDSHGQREAIPLYHVAEQAAGARGQGPAIVEDDFFTLRVPHDWALEFSPNKDLLLTREVKRGSR